MYKRYMVFSWLAYDNVSPFECVDGHFDNLHDAIILKNGITKDQDAHGTFACIFDRVEGKMCPTNKEE